MINTDKCRQIKNILLSTTAGLTCIFEAFTYNHKQYETNKKNLYTRQMPIAFIMTKEGFPTPGND
jgi:hypothetical protein